jgi:Tol biopolymer transport system component
MKQRMLRNRVATTSLSALLALASLAGQAARPDPVDAVRPGVAGAIAFASNGDIWTVQQDHSGLSQLTADSSLDSGPSWSPDGSRLAFARGPLGGTDTLMIMNADGTGVSAAAGSPSHVGSEIAWAPDGRTIAVLAPFPDEGDIAFYDVDAHTTQEFLAPHVCINEPFPCSTDPIGIGASDLAWGPDGDRLVYVGFYDPQQIIGNSAGLWIVDRDGLSEPTPVCMMDPSVMPRFNATPCPGGPEHPSWSPDGSRIVFGKAHDVQLDGGEIYSIGPDGSNLQLLPTSNFDANQPAWSPDGNTIAFTVSNAVYVRHGDGTAEQITPLMLADDPDWQCLGPTCLLPATVRIVKEVDALGGIFPATFTYSGSVTGSITHTGDPFAPPGSFFLEGKVPAGAASITEGVNPDWSLTSITCDKRYTASLTTRTVTLQVASADVVTCIFTSTASARVAGAIRLTQHTDPPGATLQYQWSGNVAGSLRDGEALTALVAPGTYTFTQAPVPGSPIINVVCSDADSGASGTDGLTFRVGPGESVACDVTNRVPIRCRTSLAGWRSQFFSTDAFQFDVAIDWCSDGRSVSDVRANSSGTMIMPAVQTTAYSLLAITWRVDDGQWKQPTTTDESDGSRTITAEGNFDTCFGFPEIGGTEAIRGFEWALTHWNILPKSAQKQILVAVLSFVLRGSPPGEKTALEALAAQLVSYGYGLFTSGVCFDSWLPTVTVRLHPDGTVDWVDPPQLPGALTISYRYQ